MFRNENKIGLGNDCRDEGEVPAVSAHDLHDERPAVGVRRRDDGVDGGDDPVQRRVRSDGHVGAAEVVVDGADDADNVETRVVVFLLFGDQILRRSI